MKSLIQKAEQLHTLSKWEIVSLLKNSSEEESLCAAADRVRHGFVGDGVLLRGLIEFSSYCRRNCCYCGLRSGNFKVHRFRLDEDEIVKLAMKAKNCGYQTVVLQSGEDEYFTAKRLCDIVEKIKKLDLAVTLSIGERPTEEYRFLREAGADRFLLRIETTDADLYKKHDPGMSHTDRLRCLDDLRKLGYEVGTGSLIGLPGQTIESLADDILYFKSFDADMVGIGPFIPNDETPLKDAPAGDIHLVLRMLAVIRLLLPEANIPATTAMETLLPKARMLALQAGANVIMPNVTEGKARESYALYPGKADVADTPEVCGEILREQLKKIGRFVENSKGFRQHRN